jgi:uncharacterized membrane protein
MNWKLVFSLSSLGLVMGIVTVLGLSRGFQLALWIPIGVFSAILIATKAPTERLRHGFITGFIAGAMVPLTQAILFTTYVSNNPQILEDFKKVSVEMGLRASILALAPITGIFTGVGLSLGTWLAGVVIDGEIIPWLLDSLFRRR